MTVYIAGPMSGLPNYNFDRFNAKETELLAAGHRVLNPAKIGILPDYEMYWPINRAMLDGAEVILMLEGWENSPGAIKELLYASRNGLAVVFEMAETITLLLEHRKHSVAVSKRSNCNNCALSKTCQHAPGWGEPLRINCHLWEAELA
ncbi:DUF4406 domain-containing protein [Eubacteriales bacterium OttesenSCG-928-A19]|nr:DUF4406 domain-containing protein [Eubacteriales bacterium OttesenSCG-928-A19]